MGPPAETGAALIAYMCERLGAPSLAGLDVLDFGCGVRFADALVNRRLPLGTYTGIDVDGEMIDFLATHVEDPRFTFAHIDARNPKYNPRGVPLQHDSPLPVAGRAFDLICMFSVITHQVPDDAAAIFSILRRYVRQDGALFFSAHLREGGPDYGEHNPDSPTALSIYSPRLLTSLLTQAGWSVESIEPEAPRGLPILDSLVCSPA